MPFKDCLDFRDQIFETLIIWYQVVFKLFTKDYLFSPWAQVKHKFEFGGGGGGGVKKKILKALGEF
jgi:hypothetical protein